MTVIPESLRPAFRVVQAADPDLAARMLADREWQLSGQMQPSLIGAGYGVTGYLCETCPPVTQLDPLSITWTALSLGVDPANFAAVVLAHEYAHVSQGHVEDTPEVEAPAYAAGSGLAGKIPGPDGPVLRRFSEDSFRELSGG